MDDEQELRRIVKMTRDANDQRSKAHAKTVLKHHVTKKFKTTMIGALHQFEKLFGDLWAHGIDKDELTDEEIDWREKWELARLEILNNGNDQTRAALQEIDHYSVSYDKNEYQFTLKDRKGLTSDE